MAVAHLADVVGVVVLRAHRRRAHPLGALEAGLAERLLERQPQVLRAGLGEHVAALVAGGGDLVEGVAGRHVDDVERHVAGDVAEHDRPVRGLGLERRRARVAVVLRVGLAAGERLLHEHVDGDPVLGVHHDHRPAVGGALHRPQDLAVVAVEHAGVGHEQLEAGDALVLGEVLHRLQRLVVDAADDLVEGVVDGALAAGLAVPLGEPLVDVLAVALHGHVDDRRDAAPRRRPRAGLERVGGERAAERQLHVGVHVDPAGDHVLAGGVDHAVGALLGRLRSGRARRRRRSPRRRSARPGR